MTAKPKRENTGRMQNFDSPQDYSKNPNPAFNMEREQPFGDYTNTLNSSDVMRNEYFKLNVASLAPDRNPPNPIPTSMQATFSPRGQFNPFEFVATPNTSMYPQYSQQFRPQFRPQQAPYIDPRYDQRYAYAPPDRYQQMDQNYDFVPPNYANDRPSVQRTDSPERLIKLKLDHKTGRHATADAVVYLPPGFNPNQKYDIVVFNHGHRSSAESSMREFSLAEQMKRGNPQTVLIVPEWQVTAAASNNAQGRFAQQGFFTDMLKEILQKTPELAQGGLDSVERMHIFSHSAGYTPTGSILNKNPELASKIQSVTMLDSLYADTVTPWIEANKQALASGEKQFRNIFGSSTQGNSRFQQERVRRMMARFGRPDAVQVMDGADSFREARSGIIFTRTRTAHGLIPNQFIANSMDHSDEA